MQEYEQRNVDAESWATIMCKIGSKQESFGATKARAGLTKTIFCAIFLVFTKSFLQGWGCCKIL